MPSISKELLQALLSGTASEDQIALATRKAQTSPEHETEGPVDALKDVKDVETLEALLKVVEFAKSTTPRNKKLVLEIDRHGNSHLRRVKMYDGDERREVDVFMGIRPRRRRDGGMTEGIPARDLTFEILGRMSELTNLV